MFRDVPGCSGMFRLVPECSVFRVHGIQLGQILTSVTHFLLRRRALCPGLYAKQNEGYLRMRKILIQINVYFVIKIWQMRNVSTQNRKKLFFPFFFQFQSNNYAIFHNAIYVHAKCSTRWRMCQASIKHGTWNIPEHPGT